MDITKKEHCNVCEQIHEEGLKSKPPKLSRAGKIILGVGAASAAVVYGIAIPFVLPGFRKICLPFVPATETQINAVITCIKGRSGSVIDLGSGDGRILHQIAKNLKTTENPRFTQLVGVELNTWLVLYSKFKSWRDGYSNVTFYKDDIFRTDLSQYENIVVFGVESLMDALEAKLEREMREDAVLVACRFPLPNWTPAHIEGEGIDTVWSYKPRHRLPIESAV